MNEISPVSRRPAFLDGTAKKLLIDGKWVDALSGKTFESINPSTGEALDRVALGDAEDIDLAVAAARRAFEGPWSKFRPADRAQVLFKLADLIEANGEELGLLDSIDMGMPIKFCAVLAKRITANLRFAAAAAVTMEGATHANSLPVEMLTYSVKEPIGVVGAITPFNGPMFQACWKIGPVLATGCTLVLKPAEQASFSALKLGELCLEAGAPPGVINVVTGMGEAGAALAEHMDVNKISFTGSTETGQKIIRASAANIKKLTLELGGKSPDIVFADADLDLAVPTAAMGAFVNSGQACSAGTRLFVERKIYEEFTERVAAFARNLKLGNGLDPATDMGPIASTEQLTRVCGYLDTGKQEGATALSGGARVTDGEMAKGFYVPPTTFVNVSDDMKIAREEIFGPVISAIPFDDIDEVIKRGNATPYGLAGGVWTRDINKAQKVVKGLRAGTVYVNTYAQQDPAVPFGGYKMSGYGRENGKQHYEEYMVTKSVFVRYG